MKAVFSFATTHLDAQNRHAGFPDDEAFACSCILSVLEGRRHLGRAELYADERGRRWFEQLALPFDAVHPLPTLDEFYQPQLWMTTKLLVYRAQAEPFLHVDLDAYLWQPLPPRLAGAGVICQSSEHGYPAYDAAFRHLLEHGGYVPDFVREYHRKHGYRIEAICAGAYGGHDLAAIHHCCDEALRTVLHPANAAMFARLAEQFSRGENLLLGEMNIIMEQLFTGIYFAENQTDVRYVLSDDEPPYFTHLIAGTKRNATNMTNLRARTQADYPAYYRRAQQARI